EAAITIDAERWTAHHRLAVARLQLGRWEAAAEALHRAIALAAQDPGAISDLGEMRRQLASAIAQIEATAPPHVKNLPVVEQFKQRQTRFWTVENLGADVFAVERWLEQLSA